jgi:hypothetical protein
MPTHLAAARQSSPATLPSSFPPASCRSVAELFLLALRVPQIPGVTEASSAVEDLAVAPIAHVLCTVGMSAQVRRGQKNTSFSARAGGLFRPGGFKGERAAVQPPC